MATSETGDKIDAAARVVDEKIDAARSAAGERIGRLKETVGTVADGVKARASALREKIRDTDFDDVVENGRGFVRDNPGKSIAIALGVGFVIGLLLRRRGDD
jgi:ElaB/YqjD/DUF883 family membrane-anchored ribosome-binding protein